MVKQHTKRLQKSSVFQLYFFFFNSPQNLNIKDLNSASGTGGRAVTFESLKPRLVNLVITALQVETDLVNTQALLGKLLTIGCSLYRVFTRLWKPGKLMEFEKDS